VLDLAEHNCYCCCLLANSYSNTNLRGDVGLPALTLLLGHFQESRCWFCLLHPQIVTISDKRKNSTRLKVTEQNRAAEGFLDVLLDDTTQRTSSHGGFVTFFSQPFLRN